LQSIIGNPVRSRNDLTAAAVISAMTFSAPHFLSIFLVKITPGQPPVDYWNRGDRCQFGKSLLR